MLGVLEALQKSLSGENFWAVLFHCFFLFVFILRLLGAITFFKFFDDNSV